MPESRKSWFGNAWRVAALAIILLGLFSGLACASNTDSEKIKVVATVFPLGDFVKNVGGEKVEVSDLMSAGDSPHTWEPLPSQVKTIADAGLIVINGAGLEFWIEKVVEAAASPDLVVVDTSIFVAMEGLLLTGDEGDHGHEESHHGVNPHIWLDPLLAQKQVEAIAQALIMVDPDNSDTYLENAAVYIAELNALDEDIRNTTESFSVRQFIAFHPAWTYFANRYGLTEVAVIEKAPGLDSAAHWKDVIDEARETGIETIFAELQSKSQAPQTIAENIEAEVIFLDPIGGVDQEGRDSYIALMRYNAEQMAVAMQ